MANSFKIGQAPWEVNQPQSFAIGQAPWETEQPGADLPIEEQILANIGRSSDVIDEMHPALQNLEGVKTRAVYKNFATDPEAGFNYLQKRHPNLNWKKEGNEVLVKQPNEAKWRKLDPSSFELQDISDIGTDILSGVAETAASAAGGIAGGIGGTAMAPGAGTVAGALGGAAVAGGAAGAGTELARQLGGKALGIEQGIDPEMIGVSAGLGVISPLLLGSGAGIKQVGREALKRGLSDKATKMLVSAQEGALSRGFGAIKGGVGRKVGSTISGVDEETIRLAATDDMLEKIKRVESGADDVSIAADLQKRMYDIADAKRNKAGEMVGQVKQELGDAAKVNISDIRADFNKVLEEYTELATRDGATPDLLEQANWLDEFINSNIPAEDFIDADMALNLKSRLNAFNKVHRLADQGRSAAFAAGETPAERALKNKSIKAAKALNDKLDEAAGGRLKAANKEYQKSIQIDNTLKKYFKDPETAGRTLRSLANNNERRQIISQLQDVLGVDKEIIKAAKEASAIKTFARPSKDILSMGGVTSTSRSVPLSAAGTIGGYYLGSQAGEGHGGGVAGGIIGAMLGSRFGSPYAIRKAIEADRAAAKLAQRFQNLTPAQTAQTGQTIANIWSNISNEGSKR